jgi:CubicO group peptidase (beta-lactamase class C family)
MKIRILITSLAALIIAAPLLAAENKEAVKREPKPDAQVVAEATAAIDKAVAEDRFSGVVLLAKEGKPILSRATGMADPEKGAPNRIDTKLNLGSINKLFTRIAIGQLAAAGKLGLGDTLRKQLPDYPSPAADKITIQQLLDHRSGLGDFFGPRFLAAPPSSIRKLSDYVALFADKPLELEPGSDQRYSNAGYVVLGLIIEKVSGQSYYDYVREHITKPAGMIDTAYYAIDENVPNRAIGQTKRGPDGPLPQRHSNATLMPGRGSSAGGGYSTAPDLLKLSQALLGNKLLSKEWTDWLFTGKVDSGGQRGLGIAGGAPGVNAALEIAPPYTLIILSNFDPPSSEELSRAIRAALGGGGRERGRKAEGPEEVLIGGRVDIPMAIESHLPVIEAKVNGKGPYRFVVDSGFGQSMEVSAELAQTLALPVVGEAIAADPSGKNSRNVRILHAESIDIGAAHFGSVDVAQRRPGMDRADGVIGLPLFATLLVTFDYPKGRLRIDGGKLPAADGAHILDYTAEHGVPTIEIDVAGQTVKTDIDSGSPAEVSLPLSVAKSLPLGEEPKVAGHGRTPGNEFDIYSAPLTGEVHVGQIALVNPRLDFVELFPDGNLGYRFLKNLTVTFDPANHRVRFEKP